MLEELFGLAGLIRAKCLEHRLDRGPEPSRRLLGEAAERLAAPVMMAVGRVLEHLAHDLPARPGVGEALALDECGNRVLVREEEVDAPTVRAGGRIGHRHLALDEKPASRVVGRDLVTR